MARIFISGSSEGLGLLSGKLLASQGHQVTLHARNRTRAQDARAALPEAELVVEGDVSSIAGMRAVAEQANAAGHYDAVIHNVAVGYSEPRRIETEDGLPHVFAVNSVAPYVLTALMHRPGRLVYVSSGLHKRARGNLADLQWTDRRWDGMAAYCESKLHNAMLAFAIARRWPDVLSNAMEPGWVPTRMGGICATGNLDKGRRTQAWLAVSDDSEAAASGGYFYHQRRIDASTDARDPALQDRLIDAFEKISGIALPAT